MTIREVSESRECRRFAAATKHPHEWAECHLRALRKKGLVFTDAPGAAKGYWRPTKTET